MAQCDRLPYLNPSTFRGLYIYNSCSSWIALLFFLSARHLYASEVYFSPEGGVHDQIIKRINTCKTTIDVAVYSFTSGDIAEALANASKRGVKVRVVRDASQSSGNNDENEFLR